jgi:hypothetical protein
VLVGLLLGEAEDLLDARAEAGERGPAALLELLGLICQLLLSGAERLLGLARTPLRVIDALFRLGAGSLGLSESRVESLNEVVDLVAVVTSEHDREVGLRVRVLEERQ